MYASSAYLPNAQFAVTSTAKQQQAGKFYNNQNGTLSPNLYSCHHSASHQSDVYNKTDTSSDRVYTSSERVYQSAHLSSDLRNQNSSSYSSSSLFPADYSSNTPPPHSGFKSTRFSSFLPETSSSLTQRFLSDAPVSSPQSFHLDSLVSLKPGEGKQPMAPLPGVTHSLSQTFSSMAGQAQDCKSMSPIPPRIPLPHEVSGPSTSRQ